MDTQTCANLQKILERKMFSQYFHVNLENVFERHTWRHKHVESNPLDSKNSWLDFFFAIWHIKMIVEGQKVFCSMFTDGFLCDGPICKKAIVSGKAFVIVKCL